MNTYKKTYPGVDHVSQSRVVHSGRVLTGCLNRWSVQLLRRRSRYGGAEKRGWTLFVSVGRMRGEIGTR